MSVLDHSTVACSDKFGNVFVLHVPDSVSDEAEVGGAGGSSALWEQGQLNGAANKLELLTHYYLGMALSAVTTKLLFLCVVVFRASTPCFSDAVFCVWFASFLLFFFASPDVQAKQRPLWQERA
jgi:hypothetical protein